MLLGFKQPSYRCVQYSLKRCHQTLHSTILLGRFGSPTSSLLLYSSFPRFCSCHIAPLLSNHLATLLSRHLAPGHPTCSTWCMVSVKQPMRVHMVMCSTLWCACISALHQTNTCCFQHPQPDMFLGVKHPMSAPCSLPGTSRSTNVSR